MAYIPKKHRKYNLLPRCCIRGGEVFSYSSRLQERIEKFLPKGKFLIPYGYHNYTQFYSEVRKYINRFKRINIYAARLLIEYEKNLMKENKKEEWSVLKYIGPDLGFLGLHTGVYYYWPTSFKNPIYNGVIDEEEFTGYMYSTKAEYWEIAEDPTGMAYNTIYGKSDKIQQN